MNIYTVRDNLKKTIEGKEAYLKDIKFNMAFGDGSWQSDLSKQVALHATTEFLEININELKVILFDVEKCCEEWNLMSWEINPERMGH